MSFPSDEIDHLATPRDPAKLGILLTPRYNRAMDFVRTLGRIVCCAVMVGAGALSAQGAPGVDLDRAGDNRSQWELAWRDAPAAHRGALQFLLQHMPDEDLRTLSAEFVLRNVALAEQARAAVPWGATLTDELYWGYVLPYAQANERREDWRSDFVARFLPKVQDCKTPGEAAKLLNETVFAELNVHYSTGRARADQAPSESIAQGKASCTGLSILLADACRACAVPARLVSVVWPHKAGNHTWVEVWDGADWRFVGADEPDPAGLDRGWFVGDAAQAAASTDLQKQPWAVSFARTEARFAAGWTRGVMLWGVNRRAKYGAPAAATPDGDALDAQLDRWFAADAERRATMEFDRNLDAELRTAEGDARLRAKVFAALVRSERETLRRDHEQNVVRAGGKLSPFTKKQVGERPANGWPLVIAMHGGGGVPKRVNDGQWQHMQIYYKDHPEAGGYLYCALRAPTDEWNGFYTDYFYPVLEKLIRQFVVCDGVDPERVVAIGYSHGGYGAFAIGPKLPHRFAAVHASAAAPTDGQTSAVGLHTLAFSFMVGGKDTAYGRRERCEAFAKSLAELRKVEPTRYPAEFTLVENNGHTGLPDRDLLATLVPKVRAAMPTRLAWELTDGAVKDHYWLRAPEPRAGVRVDVALKDGRMSLARSGELALQAWLDARLHPLDRTLVVRGDDERRYEPQPSLRTLCTTMLERGDPALAASWIVDL